MFGYLKLKAEIRELRAENELLKKELKNEKNRSVQWGNLMEYTGKAQSTEGLYDD